MQCEKDGQKGYKWGENGVCFVGPDAEEKAIAVGRAIHAGNQDLFFKFSENKSKHVQIARTGIFDHKVYGKFSITFSDLEKMKTNFEADVRRQKIDGNPVLPFDYSHYDEDKAAGWIVGLKIEEIEENTPGSFPVKNGALFAEVKWTPQAAEKIRSHEFKFVSPSIARDYKDAETGKKYDVVLMGAALTNIPFLRDMEAIHLLSEDRRIAFESLKLSGDKPGANFQKGEKMPNFNEILEELKDISPEDKEKLKKAVEEQNAKLSEKNANSKKELEKAKVELEKAKENMALSEVKLKKLKTEMSGSDEVADRLKLAESEAKDLREKVSSLTKKMAENDKKSEFDQMLSEGKVCEAQRKPFMENDMADFAKKAQAVKLDESGSNSKGDESVEEAVEKINKLAEKRAKDDEIEYGEAVSLTLSENPELKKKAGY